MSLFLDGLGEYLRYNLIFSHIFIRDAVLTVIHLANDILGHSLCDLQSNLDFLYNCCQTWSLEVNISKTKIMVFRKRVNVHSNEIFTYNESDLEAVDSFNNLGTIVNCTGSFRVDVNHVSG